MVVLLTGASGNLGPAVRAAFEARGGIVVPVSRRSGIAADLTDPDDAQRVVEEVVRTHGRLDVLAHVLGGYEAGARVEETSVDIWRRMMQINLDAAFYTVRAALPHLRRTGNARIIAVGSRAGAEPAGGASAYSVSKAGLHALIEVLAAELKGSGVTANAVLPSFIGAGGVAPEAIARLICWLASPEAADVNGALIPIYGSG